MTDLIHPTRRPTTSWTGLLVLFVVALLAASLQTGCGSDKPAKLGSRQCSTSADCDGDNQGELCTGGKCVACATDEECAADPDLGATSPYCSDGVCVACADGKIGCACAAGDTCDDGECVQGTCTDCARGDLACICRANDTCTADDVVCGDDGLCRQCQAGEQDCPCDDTDPNSCNDGLKCDSGTCVPDDCTAGALDCPCDADGACVDATAYCDDNDVCKSCSSDIAGCGCDQNGECQNDLYCGDQDTCQECGDTNRPATCACDDTRTCAQGLICDGTDSVCRAPLTCADLDCQNQTCDENADGEDATCTSGECVDGYYWNGSACAAGSGTTCYDASGLPTSDEIDCEDQGKACVDTPAGAQCVDTCESLDCLGDHRDCTPGVSTTDDAVCGDCQPGFVDDGSGTCVVDTTANCVIGDPNSLVDTCAARYQQCESVNGGGATCGDCLSGRVYDPESNSCIEVKRCGNSICTDSQFCYYPEDGATPSCMDRCASGQAYDPSSDSCVSCSIGCGNGELFGTLVDGSCACEDQVYCQYQYDQTVATRSRCFETPCADGEAADATGTCSACPTSLVCGQNAGERSRIWPVRDSSGQCTCETQQGYYHPYGQSGAPAECDADADGWINDSANDSYLISTSGTLDLTVLGNFRCDRRTIDRVRLVNEYGQRRYLAICKTQSGKQLFDWSPEESLPTDCQANGLEEVVLKEPDDLDSDAAIGNDDTLYPYDGTRKLKAAEVNAMTKACVSSSADYNDNLVDDITEEQALSLADVTNPTKFNIANPDNGDFLFAATSYFVELHTGHYEAASIATDPGQYVITERSRCDDVAPVYEVGPGFYDESCLRRRDDTFDASGNRTGYDFAYWSCSDVDSGTCPLPDPTMLLTGNDTNNDRITDHDLCALKAAGMLPLKDSNGDIIDTPWLGMNHHSQFRCMAVGTSTDFSKATIDRTVLSGASGGAQAYWDFSTCEATDCSSSTNTMCAENRSQTSGRNPLVPEFGCTYHPGDTSSDPNAAGAPADGDVGFVAARFTNFGGYTRGCVNESLDTIDGDTKSLDQNKGFSKLCPGYESNADPAAFLTAGNPGDFGRLMCSCNVNYGGDQCQYACPADITTQRVDANNNNFPASNPGGSWRLHVGGPQTAVSDPTRALTTAEKADYACFDSGYCLTYDPYNENGISFQGGRRGFWMCGNFTATRPADSSSTDPFHDGTTQSGQNLELRGAIKLTPMVRTPTDSNGAQQQPSGCTSANNCFTLF